jgi:hypothetical protein
VNGAPSLRQVGCRRATDHRLHDTGRKPRTSSGAHFDARRLRLSGSPPADQPVQPVSYEGVTGAISKGLIAILFAPVGSALAFLPPLRHLNAEAVCGHAAEILVSSSDLGDGTSYGLYCSNDLAGSLFGHYASAVALYFALVFSICLVVALGRWPHKSASI